MPDGSMSEEVGDILVTGATGNVGAATIAALGRLGVRPRAAVRDVVGSRGRVGDATPVAFDFTALETFAAAFAGVRGMLLVRPPALANVRRDIAPALDAARAAGVERVVFLSLLGCTGYLGHPRRPRRCRVVRAGRCDR